MHHDMIILGEMLVFAHCLCTVGEAGTVKIKMDTIPKLEDQGVHWLFVGYSLTHPSGCYRMYDPEPVGCILLKTWPGCTACFIRKQTLWESRIWTLLV